MGTKFSALPAVASVTTASIMAVDQAGTSKRMTLAQLFGGIAGGGSFTGGTGSGDNLDLLSTSHATKGKIRIGGATGALVIDEANSRIGIGTLSPEAQVHLKGTEPWLMVHNTDAGVDEGRWLVFSADDGSYRVLPKSDAGAGGDTFFKLSRVATSNEIKAMAVGDNTGSWTLRANVTTGNVALQTPSSAPAGTDLQNGQAIFYTSGSSFMVKHHDGTGTETTATLGTLA
jgi:hypothetical protein